MNEIKNYLRYGITVSIADTALNLVVEGVFGRFEKQSASDIFTASIRQAFWQRIREQAALHMPLLSGTGFIRRNIRAIVLSCIFPHDLNRARKTIVSKTKSACQQDTSNQSQNLPTLFDQAMETIFLFATSEIAYSCTLWLAGAVSDHISTVAGNHFRSQITSTEHIAKGILFSLGFLYLSHELKNSS